VRLIVVNKLLSSVLKEDEETPKIASIGAMPNAVREFVPYADSEGKGIFHNEMKKLNQNQQSELIRLIMEGKEAPVLKMPLFKSFKDTSITGEVRDLKDGWRILLYKIDNQNYLMLNFFKKKSDETPRSEIAKAERRIAEYIDCE
jgi:phage-related protein